MMRKLPTKWSQDGHWLTCEGQVRQPKRDSVQMREAHHGWRTLADWTKMGEAARLTRTRAACRHGIPDTTCERGECSKTSSQSPLSTRVRICSSKWAPRWLQR